MTQDIATIPEKPPTPKAILWLSILMILLFLYQLYSQFGLLTYMFKNGTAKWDFPMAMYFLRPLIIMPIGAILFALRKKVGWVLLSGFFTYLAINTIVLLFVVFKHSPQPSDPIGQSPPASPMGSLPGWIIFIGGCLYFIYKRDVQKVYGIDRQSIGVAIVLGIVLTFTAAF